MDTHAQAHQSTLLHTPKIERRAKRVMNKNGFDEIGHKAHAILWIKFFAFYELTSMNKNALTHTRIHLFRSVFSINFSFVFRFLFEKDNIEHELQSRQAHIHTDTNYNSSANISVRLPTSLSRSAVLHIFCVCHSVSALAFFHFRYLFIYYCVRRIFCFVTFRLHSSYLFVIVCVCLFGLWFAS